MINMYTKEIAELYKSIPSSVCSDGCSKCCTNMIQFSPSEERRMGGYEWNGRCSHLKDGKCSIYENRPFICRIYGTNELMRCDGCQSEKYLSEKEAAELIHKYTFYRNEEIKRSYKH